MLIFHVIWAVNTAVYTVIGEIKWRKNNNAVAVKSKLYSLSYTVDFFYLFGDITSKQYRCLSMIEPSAFVACCGFFRTCFFKYTVYQLDIALIFFSVFECFTDFGIVDEFLCFEGFGIVYSHNHF